MPKFKLFSDLRVSRRIRAFLDLQGGLVRNILPLQEEQDQEGAYKDEQIRQLRHDLSVANSRLRQRESRIKKQRQRLKNGESEGLQFSGGGRGNSREDVPPFFVTGGAKSGTGWLVGLLNSHPEVLCRGEGRFFGRETTWGDHSAWQGQGQERRRRASSNVAPTSLQYALWHDELLRFWLERSPWARKTEPEEHLKNLTRLATNYFLSEGLAAAGRQTKHVVGDKTPLKSPDILQEISEVYPEARVIHIVRDGRDRAVSRMHQFWRNEQRGRFELEPESIRKRDAYHSDREQFGPSGESIFTEEQIRTFAAEWRDRVGRSIEDGPALMGDNGYTEIKYENLLAQPEKVGELYEFLGVSADTEIVKRSVEANNFEKLSGRQRGEEPEGIEFKKRRKGVAGDWRNVFTERDREIFKEEAGDLLLKLGYETDKDW